MSEIESLNKKYKWSIPTVCPVCGEKVIVNDSGIPECPNEACPRKVAHRFKRIFKVFGIKGTGDFFVSNLEEKGITIEDFFEMCSNNDSKCFNKYAGGINGEKIYKQMKTVMTNPITPAQFLALFDVKLFDEKKLNQLGNMTLDEMLSLDYNKLTNIDGFADITATAFVNSLISFYKDEINSLRNYFIFEIKKEEVKTMSKGSVCFTGACATHKRNELSEMAIKAGYDVKDLVTKDLTILVCADPNSGSSKLQKAAKNGTTVISYEEFLKNSKF